MLLEQDLTKYCQIWVSPKSKILEILQNHIKINENISQWSEICLKAYIWSFGTSLVDFEVILKDFKIFDFGDSQIWQYLVKSGSKCLSESDY